MPPGEPSARPLMGRTPALAVLAGGAAVALALVLPLTTSVAIGVLLVAMLGVFFSAGVIATAEGRAAGISAGGWWVLRASCLAMLAAVPLWGRVLIVPQLARDTAEDVYAAAVAFEAEHGRAPRGFAELGYPEPPRAWGVPLHFEVLPGEGTPAGDRWLLWFEEPVWWSRWSLYGPRSRRWLKQAVFG